MSSTVSVTTTTSQATLSTASDKDDKAKKPHKIPHFQTKEETRRWQLEQMAGAFRVFAKLGFADGGSGHISLRGKLSSTMLFLPWSAHLLQRFSL